MKLTYAQLMKMMGVINEMIQVKPGALVGVTSVLGMNASRVEAALKGYTLAHNAIRADVLATVPCVLAQIVECEHKGPIVTLLSGLHGNAERWDELVAADQQLVGVAARWFQRGDFRLSDE